MADSTVATWEFRYRRQRASSSTDCERSSLASEERQYTEFSSSGAPHRRVGDAMSGEKIANRVSAPRPEVTLSGGYMGSKGRTARSRRREPRSWSASLPYRDLRIA